MCCWQSELEEIPPAVEALLRLSGAAETENRFTAFRRSFLSRYADREIPLVEALCDEVGIGFDSSSAPAADASPLLAGPVLPGPDPPPAVAWGPARELVFRKLGDVLAAGEHELLLEPRELDALPDSGEIRLADGPERPRTAPDASPFPGADRSRARLRGALARRRARRRWMVRSSRHVGPARNDGANLPPQLLAANGGASGDQRDPLVAAAARRGHARAVHRRQCSAFLRHAFGWLL